MAKYEPGDIVTYYFVVREDDKHGNRIVAWTDKKDLVQFYMKLHKCPNHRLKKITKTIEEINQIIGENRYEEIKIGNIYTLNRNSKKNRELVTVSLPITDTEFLFVREECNSFYSGEIDYGYLNGVIPYMKKKYQNVLEDILLLSIIKKVVYNKNDKINQQLDLDQLILLFKCFPDDFGK